MNPISVPSVQFNMTVLCKTYNWQRLARLIIIIILEYGYERVRSTCSHDQCIDSPPGKPELTSRLVRNAAKRAIKAILFSSALYYGMKQPCRNLFLVVKTWINRKEHFIIHTCPCQIQDVTIEWMGWGSRCIPALFRRVTFTYNE